MALLLSALLWSLAGQLWSLAGQQLAPLAPKAADEQPPRILTSPDPDQPAPPKSLTPPAGLPQWPAVELPAPTTPKTTPATVPWPERQPAAGRQPGSGLALPPAEVQTGTTVPSVSRLVAECFSVPPKELLPGRPVSLLEAVSRSSDRQQQLQIIRAYWQTARATANLGLCAEHQALLEQLRMGPADAGWLEAGRAAAAALLSQARVVAIAAQHDLAAAMRWPADAPLPLAADPPHAGDYRTYFAELFATRAAPERARRANATIPLRRQAVQHWAAAMLAADRAAAAMLDPRGVSPPAAAQLLDTLQQCLRQRQALADAVVLYNLDIAEYAVAVAGPEVTPQVLVNMLIRPRTANPSAMNDNHSAVRTVGYDQHLQGSGKAEIVPPGAPQPTAADMLPRPTAVDTPTASPLSATGTIGQPQSRNKSQPPTDATDGLQPPPALRIPGAILPQGQTPSATNNSGPVTAPLAPVEPAAHIQQQPPTETTLRRPLLPLAPMLYSALQTAPPTSRAKQLAVALHWDRALPEHIGQPLSLQQAVAAVPVSRRLATIEAYWRARQKAAEYQVFVQQLQWLDEISDSFGGDTGAAAQWLAVAKQQAQAKLINSHAELVEAQYKLALLVYGGAGGHLPLPGTMPHAGGYQLRLEMQPPELAASRTVRRLGALVPALADAFHKQADAVVAADAARAKAAEALGSGTQSLDALLSLTSQQTETTIAFLEALSAYNIAIAEYALAVVPADIPAQTLVGALVARQ